jgi:nucleotide-binding universal stress UspA family protein
MPTRRTQPSAIHQGFRSDRKPGARLRRSVSEQLLDLHEQPVPGKPIVCAVRDPETASGVIRHAEPLARSLASALILLHVQPASAPPRQVSARRAARRAHARAEAVRATAYGAVSTNVRPDVRIALGAPSEEIVQLARHEEAEFIAVGSRGRRGLSASTVGRVLRQAPCPVLLAPLGAPPPARNSGPAAGRSTVIAAIDGSESASQAALVAADVAIRLGAHLLLVHAYRPEGTVRKQPIAMPEALEWTEVSPSEYEGRLVIQQALRLTGGAAVLGPGPAPVLLDQVARMRNAVLRPAAGDTPPPAANRTRGSLRPGVRDKT